MVALTIPDWLPRNLFETPGSGALATTLPYEYVDDLTSDGAANAATLQALIDDYESMIAANIRTGVEIRLPAYGAEIPITGEITVQQDRINIGGGGSWATRVIFTPDGSGRCGFKFGKATAAILYQCGLRDMSIKSDDTATLKVAVTATDTSGFTMTGVAIGPEGGWTNAAKTCIGVQIKGRDHFLIARNNLSADRPLVVQDNPNLGSIDFDVSVIRENLLIADSNPNMHFEDSVLLTNVSIHDNSMNKGTHGLYHRDTVAAGQSLAVSFVGNRWEQGPGGGWLFYFERTAQVTLNLTIIDNHVGGPFGDNGFFLRGVLAGVLMANSVAGTGIAVDADSSVNRFVVIGNFVSSTTTVNLTGIHRNILSGGGPSSTTPLYAFEVWTSTTDFYVDERQLKIGVGAGTGMADPNGTVFRSIAPASTTASATPQTLWSDTLPASSLVATARALRIEVWGTTAANANTKTIRVKFGAHSITLNNVTTAPNGVNWYAEVVVSRIGAAQQYAFTGGTFGAVAQTRQTTVPTETLSGNITVAVEAEPSVAVADEVSIYRVLGTYH